MKLHNIKPLKEITNHRKAKKGVYTEKYHKLVILRPLSFCNKIEQTQKINHIYI